jgi:SAM-dependent methyltransferase
MDDCLKLETERLLRSWAQYDAPFLCEYLVADVEDPRVNIQSVLSRHFLLAELFGGRFEDLMLHELRFATAMNWLAKHSAGPDERRAILHALQHGADDAEGQPIPHFLTQTFSGLPASANGLTVPNYLADHLVEEVAQSLPKHKQDERNVFLTLWHARLACESPQPVSVLEPACGSANDYRFLDAAGIARLIDYTGFDLCETNVANARALFPAVRFETGNVFDITASDQSYDLCFTHDLLEHLSPAGLERAVQELCRVTRRGLCVHFFQMDEMPNHIVRPVGDYHVNTLSLTQTEALFAWQGFAVQPFHIGSYLRQRVGFRETHNPNAYTFLAFRR